VTTGHREREEASNEVSPLELFFDLVFVFAVSQLSEYLLEHLSWRGAAETAVLLIAVFAVWSYTSFSATLPRFGWSMRVGAGFAVLFLALFMNAGLITLAVGVELTIDDPAAGSGTALSLLLFGGPVLYLAAQGWYLKALTSRTSRIRVAGVGTLVIAGLLSPALPAVASLSVVAAVLLALGLKTSFTRSAPAASPPRIRFTRHER
jgi:low temperature requirement protein LtrA